MAMIRDENDDDSISDKCLVLKEKMRALMMTLDEESRAASEQMVCISMSGVHVKLLLSRVNKFLFCNVQNLLQCVKRVHNCAAHYDIFTLSTKAKNRWLIAVRLKLGAQLTNEIQDCGREY